MVSCSQKRFFPQTRRRNSVNGLDSLVSGAEDWEVDPWGLTSMSESLVRSMTTTSLGGTVRVETAGSVVAAAPGLVVAVAFMIAAGVTAATGLEVGGVIMVAPVA